MQARQEEIRSSLEAAETAKAEADETRAQRQGILDEARQQAREIVAQANRTADQSRADGQARGQQEYERLVASADAEIALARQTCLDEITSRIGALVLSVARQVIEREIDAQRHRALIDEAVSALRAEADCHWCGRPRTRYRRRRDPPAAGLTPEARTASRVMETGRVESSC